MLGIFGDPAFWALLTAAVAATASAVRLRPVGILRAVALVIVWSCACATSALLLGMNAAMLTGALSILSGLSLLAISIIRTGIESMPNRRYENR